MKKGLQWLCLILCLCMVTSMIALAEAPAPAAEVAAEAPASTGAPAPAAEIVSDTLLVTVNGEEITWANTKEFYDSIVASYGSYYDMTDPTVVKMFSVYGMENAITKALIMQQIKKEGLELSVEDRAASDVEAEGIWAQAIESYITNALPDVTEASTQEQKDQAKVAAEAYYAEMGYSLDVLKQQVADGKMGERLKNKVTQDVAVTDADVEADYQTKVAQDKKLYENDIAAYVEYNSYVDQSQMYAMMSGGSAPNMDYSWYKPAGFRAVKHILLPADEELMKKYTDLQARLEEQMDAEAASAQTEDTPALPEAAALTEDAQAAAAPEATAAEPTAEPLPPVTQADVDNAKADILSSLSEKIDEINQKIAEGVDFNELITAYGIKADGTPSDPGMASEPYMTSGYEVARESNNYVPEFVDAAFSMQSVGDTSAPYLSNYGVHILKYIADVEAGPVPMTMEQREAKRAALLAEKQTDTYAAKLDEWRKASTIVYTGVLPSADELEAAQAAEAEEHQEMSVEGMEPEATQPEATSTEAP